MLATTDGGALSAHFIWLDWLVVLGYLALTTLLGALFAGRQATIRDFFLGGRKLPWPAVAGSIIATEISAVTFVGVPAVVFKDGGNFTYLQLGLIGALLARLVVAFVLVPAYYQREIFSPYDYMGHRLGTGVRGITTALFSLGGLLGQSARVYLTAVVLELVLHEQLAALQAATGIDSLAWAVGIIGAVAIAWTLMGGIATVIWTDVILFGVFLLGGITALAYVVTHLPGGVGELIDTARSAGKFRLWDFDPSPVKEFTVWTAVFASVFGNVGIYGTDQLMAQRIFCCRGPRQAQLAALASWAGIVVTLTMLTVGAGLFAFHQRFPLQGAALRVVDANPDRVFPVFILTQIPPGLTGLIIAGIFAAAISSLDSILAALAQTSISAVYLPLRRRHLARQPRPATADDDAVEDRRTVRVSRALVVLWGVLLCAFAMLVAAFTRRTGIPILSLALALSAYTSGALLAGFTLAFLPLGRDGWGFLWSAPLSVLCVFALVWHEPWSFHVCLVGAVAIVVSWWWFNRPLARRDAADFATRALWLMAGLIVLFALNFFAWAPGPVDLAGGQFKRLVVAWPWYAPVGFAVALLWGWLLGNASLTGAAPIVPRGTIPPVRSADVSLNRISRATGDRSCSRARQRSVCGRPRP